MTIWNFTVNGLDRGNFEGASIEEASERFARAAGYSSWLDMMAQANEFRGASVRVKEAERWKVVATFKCDGQEVSCNTPEVLGDAYGTTYPTQVQAEEAAQELQDSIAEFELDDSTEYDAVRV